jgi:hypothetical protein
MGTISTANNAENGTVPDPYTPRDIEGNPIEWEGSPGEIRGKLRAAMAFYTRTGYFKTFIEKRGVIL